MAYTGLSSLARLSIQKTAKWATGVGALCGFTADILASLGPIAGYVALAALGAAVVAALMILFRVIAAERGVPAMVFAAIVSVVTGGIYSIQKSQEAENGLLAELVPAVANLQQSLGLVSAKVDTIEKTTIENLEATKQLQGQTDELQAQTQQVQKTTEAVQQQTTQLVAAVEDIAAGFKTLGQQGGIIANPERPDQVYHNARIHELGGDVANARQAYIRFASFNVEAIDPYQRFATLLKIAEGRAGAREALGALRETNKSKSLELVWLQLLDDQQRLGKLQEFAKANPDYASVEFLLADEFSEDRLGQRALSDKRSEGEHLKAFLERSKDGGLNRYFVDQAVLADWTARAQTRLTALGSLEQIAGPTINPMRAGQGWQITVSVPEPASAIFWRMDGAGEFADTGKLAFNDQQTGQPMANPNIQLPGDAKSGTIEIKYLDIRGREVGPFLIKFNPDSALASSQKLLVEQTWTSWITFDASGFRGNVYFTPLVSFNCAIKTVKYGLNGATPDTELKLPACNPSKPFEMPADFVPYFKVGEDVKAMNVEVTYVDGTTSGVKEFRRP